MSVHQEKIYHCLVWRIDCVSVEKGTDIKLHNLQGWAFFSIVFVFIYLFFIYFKSCSWGQVHLEIRFSKAVTECFSCRVHKDKLLQRHRRDRMWCSLAFCKAFCGFIQSGADLCHSQCPSVRLSRNSLRFFWIHLLLKPAAGGNQLSLDCLTPDSTTVTQCQSTSTHKSFLWNKIEKK